MTLYTFSSKAGSDVLMTRVVAERLLQAIGKPPAASGIVEPFDLAFAIEQLERAVSSAELNESAHTQDVHQHTEKEENTEQSMPNEVSLRQRAWPLLNLLKQAAKEKHCVVWAQ
jgi:hypothetical protein